MVTQYSRDITRRSPIKTVAVVGASLAGWRTAQELREQGFDGRLVMIGAESHRPYDRPALKDFLSGKIEAEDLTLGNDDEQYALRAEWWLGHRAVKLDPRAGIVALDNDTQLRTDAVVVATGVAPATLGDNDPPGCHTLRTLDDAARLREEVHPGSRVVVVGGGLTGAEAASTCRSRGADVTIVETSHVPLAHMLGIEIAPLCTRLHEDHGVRTRYGTPAVRVLGSDRATGVELADGRVLPADVVVISVGVRPSTGWLRGSGLGLRDGVVTDAGFITRLPNVAAVGDVARYYCAHRSRTARSEYPSSAMGQPPVAVRNLLAGRIASRYTGIPQFSSKLYGSTLQFTGYAGPQDKVTTVEGSPDARRFVAVYRRAGRVVGVFALNCPKQFVHYRKQLPTAYAATPAAA